MSFSKIVSGFLIAMVVTGCGEQVAKPEVPGVASTPSSAARRLAGSPRSAVTVSPAPRPSGMPFLPGS